MYRIVNKYKSKISWKFSANKCINDKKILKTKINKQNKQRINPWREEELFILKTISIDFF